MGSMIKNTGDTLRTAASVGSDVVKRLAPKAMDVLEMGAGAATRARGGASRVPASQ